MLSGQLRVGTIKNFQDLFVIFQKNTVFFSRIYLLFFNKMKSRNISKSRNIAKVGIFAYGLALVWRIPDAAHAYSYLRPKNPRSILPSFVK